MTNIALPQDKDYAQGTKYWSTNYTIDRLKEHLAKIKHNEITSEDKSIEGRKYYDHAFELLKIGAFKPTMIVIEVFMWKVVNG